MIAIALSNTFDNGCNREMGLQLVGLLESREPFGMVVTNDVFQLAGNELQRTTLLNKISKGVISVCPHCKSSSKVSRNGPLAFLD